MSGNFFPDVYIMKGTAGRPRKRSQDTGDAAPSTGHSRPGPGPEAGVAGRGPRPACVSPVCVLLQLSSTGGNLIGPELSPMRHSRPAVACRLSIRAPPAPPPPGRRVAPSSPLSRPRTGSRHAAIVYRDA
ncbi:unnamed protein product [Danaus chrysippus]|uniref:(African queen) hypothetical protein n=1 Tax=Danaus chrysippus TaxID=151541 RepID=A0A8J2QP05_9NEOP|nr:unnamed protein product [Danaus chrysippus]